MVGIGIGRHYQRSCETYEEEVRVRGAIAITIAYEHMVMSRSPYQAELELAKAAALKAGEIIRSYSSDSNYGRSNNLASVSVKSGVDLVTEADTHVERIVTDMIKEAFPEDVIVGEEDQAERPNGTQDEIFPTGRIWCGE